MRWHSARTLQVESRAVGLLTLVPLVGLALLAVDLLMVMLTATSLLVGEILELGHLNTHPSMTLLMKAMLLVVVYPAMERRIRGCLIVEPDPLTVVGDDTELGIVESALTCDKSGLSRRRRVWGIWSFKESQLACLCI